MTFGWRSSSLLRRIIISLTLANVATIAIIVVWFTLEFESASHEMGDSTLISRADEISGDLSLAADGTIQLELSPVMRRAFDNSRGRHRFSIRGADGKILLQSRVPTSQPLNFIESGEHGSLYRYREPGGEGHHMAGVARRFELGGRPLVIQVEESEHHNEALIRAVEEKVLEDGGELLLPLLFLPLGLAILVVHLSFTRVTMLSQMAETISPKANEVRLPESEIPAELAPLVKAVNAALDRLAEGLRVQTDFTAGAAHELRTPLAILRARLEAMPEGLLKQEMRRDISGMVHIIEQLLRVVQIDTQVHREKEDVDLAAVGAEVARYYAPLAIADGKALAFQTSDAPALASGLSRPIFHAISNLVGNALRHSPQGGTVTVRVTGGSEPRVHVLDQGTGVPLEFRERIFERFWRVDRSSSGSGLGLYIVRRVMDLHGGRIEVGESPNGGASFTLIFPGIPES